MRLLTKKRRAALEERILQEIKFSADMYEQLVLDKNEDEKIQQIQMGVEEAFAFFFYRPSLWNRIFNRPKKCKPIPCPEFQEFEFQVSDRFIH